MCINFWVLGTVLITLGERTLFERNIEYSWSDEGSVVNNHCNGYNGDQDMFNIAKYSITGEVQDPRSYGINFNANERSNNWLSQKLEYSPF